MISSILLLIAVICFLLQLLQVNAPPGSAGSKIDKPMLGWFCIALALLLVYGGLALGCEHQARTPSGGWRLSC